MATRRRRAFSHDPLSVVMRFVDSANRHDADAVAACVHRDFESIQPIHPVRNFRGSAQLLNNWRTIFRTEPGFRLTVLRSAVEGETVWVELHGAGDNAEVAGIFIMGVENGLIRWARVYSELIEPEPAPAIPEPLAVSVAAEAGAEPADADESDVPALRVVEASDAAEEAEPVEASDDTETAAVEAPAEPEAVPEADREQTLPAGREVEIQAALEEVRVAAETVEASDIESPGEVEEPGPTASEAAEPPQEGLAGGEPGGEEEPADEAATGTDEAATGTDEAATGTNEPPTGTDEPVAGVEEHPTMVDGEVLPQPFPDPPPASSNPPSWAGGWRRLLGRARRGQP
ncbi:MAG: nuclear transport factor 2 family protein [Actinomycetota bacterium]|nr:nuclear transport factor 2 family protein [Actinomycetota bacterium]